MFSNALRSSAQVTRRSIIHRLVVGCSSVSVSPHRIPQRFKSSQPMEEVVTFPSSNAEGEEVPILLNSKEHAVGYLSKILNARVYEAAIETKLQEAKNLSSVSHHFSRGCCINKQMSQSTNEMLNFLNQM